MRKPELAYVFWHWREASVPAAEYEGALSEFHRSLAERAPAGFLRSRWYRVARAPWTPPELPAYEDWYLLDGFAALGAIEEAAMAPPHRAPHDRVAGAVSGGTAGLYRHWLGEPDPGAGSVAWFSKPAGTSYEALRELLAPLVASSGAGVWARRLVLGPAPEFRLAAADLAALPPNLAPILTETRISGDEARLRRVAE